MNEKEAAEKIKQAIEQAPSRNFEESVDMAINLRDVDLSDPKNRIQEEIVLPAGRGKKVKVCVFGGGELAIMAKDSADTVVQPEELEDLASEKREAKKLANSHEFFIAEAPLMPTIGKNLGIVLGPRGKMPRPIPPNTDPAPMIENLRNTVRIRSKQYSTFHVPIGTRDMEGKALSKNFMAILRRVKANLERGDLNISSIYVKTTMGPSIRIM